MKNVLGKRDVSSVVRSRLVSIVHLISGNGANAAIMLVSTTFAARALGPTAYGVLALVLTIGRLSERLLRFESWQPLIRFAAQKDIESDPRQLSELFLFGLLLDVGSALLAAVLTVLGGYLLMPVIGLEPNDLPLIATYALAIAVNIRGMPTAAMRMDGQFKTLAYIQMLSSLLRVALAAYGIWAGFGLWAFIAVWTGCQMLDSLLFLWLGFRVLDKLGIPSPLRADWRGLTGRFPGFMSFAWSTNISSSMRTMTQEADTLLVGAFVGKEAAGFYHIAKRIAKVAQQVGQMIQAVIYPDMARLWARADYAGFRRTTGQIQFAMAAIGLLVLALAWLLGEQAIHLAFGNDFIGAYPLLMAQLVAVVLIMHASPSRSALLAMNRSGLVLWVSIASAVLFFATALLTMPFYGALGANFGHIAFAAFTAVAMDIAWWTGSLKSMQRHAATEG
jgi:O-antigen/teichoic acid export membrane protein